MTTPDTQVQRRATVVFTDGVNVPFPVNVKLVSVDNAGKRGLNFLFLDDVGSEFYLNEWDIESITWKPVE